MKRFLFLLLIIYPLSRFCHKQTKGFKFSKIHQNVTCLKDQISPPMPKELTSVCSQTFTYLDRGLQSFSFLSEDGQVVLKIFNNRHRRLLLWMNLPFIRHFTQKKSAYYRCKWEKTFHSYQIAIECLAQESALLYFHPSLSRNCPIVTIVDPLGSPHQISLNNYAFALQKKAIKSFDFFLECERSLDLDRAQKGIQSLIALMKKKESLRIDDEDPLIRTNIGFIDGTAMQIDLGAFSKELSSKKQSQKSQEMIRTLSGLRSFMEKNTPNLLPCLDEAIETL